jgi:hypothetical protein
MTRRDYGRTGKRRRCRPVRPDTAAAMDDNPYGDGNPAVTVDPDWWRDPSVHLAVILNDRPAGDLTADPQGFI